MIEAITLNEANVTAENDAYINSALLAIDGVIKKGNNLAYEIVSNNEIRLKDGLISLAGRYLRIKPGTTESIIIDSGKIGVARHDLIVAHFETDGIRETLDIRVKKGDDSGTIPNIIQEDTFKTGSSIYEIALYLVNLNGISITDVVPSFTLYDSLVNASNIPHITVGPNPPSVPKNGYIWFKPVKG